MRDQEQNPTKGESMKTNRIFELQALIDRADAAYYTSGAAIMEDAKYDQLREELRALNPNDPRLSRVGAAVQDTILEARKHTIPMGSQDKVTNRTEWEAWLKNNIQAGLQQMGRNTDKLQFHATYKMDGGSVGFEWEQGRLVCAISRGDGSTGEDITANAVRFKNLPHTAARNQTGFTGYTRAEIILPTAEWKEEVDPEMESNPRNKCVGIYRRKNGVQSELLQAYTFGVFDADGHPLGATETEQCELIRALGFTPPPSFTGTADEVWNWYLETAKKRAEIPYWIDGIVVKLDNLEDQKALGESSGRPRGQVAIKFEAEGAETTITDVAIQVGYTGAISPVAHFNPVRIGGTTVTNATLCNWDNIRELGRGHDGLQIGDTVRVIKAGDIIPRITELVHVGQDRKQIPEPTCCPVCQGPVGRKTNIGGEESTVLYCNNIECPAKITGLIEKFAASVEIMGLGESVIQALVTSKLVLTPADLYSLKDKVEEMAALVLNGKVKLGKKRAQNLIAEIEQKRQLTLSTFLGSLGIYGLGKRRVALVQAATPGEFDELDNWLSGKLVSFKDAVSLPNTAQRIQDGINVAKPLIGQFLANGLQIVKPQPKPEPKPGAWVICITGKLSKPKEHFAQLITEAGHVYTDDFSKQVTHLVAADPNSGSSKLKKATKQGTQVISEATLLKLLENKSYNQ